MNNGYIKLHRSLLENPICQKPDYAWLWCVLLMKANHKISSFIFNNKKQVVRPGQFITGRKKLALETGIAESQVYKILNYFENEGQIEQQKNNRYTLVTVLNWHKYQSEGTTKEQPGNSNVTAKEQPSNTNKNDKNVKNDKKGITPYQKLKDYFNKNRNKMPELKILSDNRKNTLRLRYKKYGDKLFTLFEKAGKSDFLNGTNKEGWIASFDWLLKETNLVKTLEGNYDNKTKTDWRRT